MEFLNIQPDGRQEDLMETIRQMARTRGTPVKVELSVIVRTEDSHLANAIVELLGPKAVSRHKSPTARLEAPKPEKDEQPIVDHTLDIYNMPKLGIVFTDGAKGTGQAVSPMPDDLAPVTKEQLVELDKLGGRPVADVFKPESDRPIPRMELYTRPTKARMCRNACGNTVGKGKQYCDECLSVKKKHRKAETKSNQ
jgi:hypothetical protein